MPNASAQGDRVGIKARPTNEPSYHQGNGAFGMIKNFTPGPGQAAGRNHRNGVRPGPGHPLEGYEHTAPYTVSEQVFVVVFVVLCHAGLMRFIIAIIGREFP